MKKKGVSVKKSRPAFQGKKKSLRSSTGSKKKTFRPRPKSAAASSTGTRTPKRAGRYQLFTAHAPSHTAEQSDSPARDEGIRLQKVLAASGFGSRRDCEELIVTGRVEVDRKTVTELGVKVFPHEQEIRVDGESLRKVKPYYFAVYKPKGYVCSHYDPAGRSRAVDLVPEKFGRVFPIGRLDLSSEGLLLITNDGALAERLTHPKYEVAKKYYVHVAGQVGPDIVHQLRKGVYLAEGLARAANVKIKGTHKNSSILEMELKEGKNREIRRLLARLNHKVLSLQRVAVGPVKLGKMLPGEYRPLSFTEVDALYKTSEHRR
ncbi:MAG: rRNA pseudouridine synthase [Planctomycetaceae bacterium]|jgi:23S rRNA pseudouridine2605 synthase|nr:rRNA pseudouridine synthase [Planctomycetaceae bacterium]